MELMELAMYLFFIVFMMIIATKALWIIFFLFCFRFWESILTYEFLSGYIDFAVQRDYYICIVILTVISYFMVVLSTHGIPLLRYLLLLVMMIYTVRIYEIADIMVFKDHLVAIGVWDWDYWKTQIKEMLSFSVEDFQNIIANLWNKVWNVCERLIGYIKGI